MSKKIRVVQFGLGPIGKAAARLVAGKECMQLVGGIDISPDLAGRELGEVLGLRGGDRGMEISENADALLREVKPDVVLHTTTSFLERVEEQLLTCIHAGANVVSSTEELFYPYYRNHDFCDRIDTAARRLGVVVIGTGVNPGFAMDVLPLSLTGMCATVKKVTCRRVVDASRRREPLQRKVGAGLTTSEFEQLVDQGKLGHVGLLESLLAIGDGLGWHPDTIDENIDPVVAEKKVVTPFLTVEAGQVAGIHHTCVGSFKGKKLIDLELKMFVGAKDPHDSVVIDGDPPINMRIAGGIFGDTATVAALVNTAARVHAVAPGLKTMLDLPVPRACR